MRKQLTPFGDIIFIFFNIQELMNEMKKLLKIKLMRSPITIWNYLAIILWYKE